MSQLDLSAQSAAMLRVDHYVTVKSTVPAIAGQTTSIYVREVVRPDALRANPAPDKVALFIHGAGTPAEVSFDVPLRRLQLDGVLSRRLAMTSFPWT